MTKIDCERLVPPAPSLILPTLALKLVPFPGVLASTRRKLATTRIKVTSTRLVEVTFLLRVVSFCSGAVSFIVLNDAKATPSGHVILKGAVRPEESLLFIAGDSSGRTAPFRMTCSLYAVKGYTFKLALI